MAVTTSEASTTAVRRIHWGLVSSFVMVFLLTLWVARYIESGFVLHGFLVGAVATLLFLALSLAINRSLEQPALYWVAHGLKLLGGLTGGLVAERRRLFRGSAGATSKRYS